MQTPFFVIGSERSGSTMFRLMLDHHPEIACNLESDFLVSQMSDEGAPPDMRAYHAFLAQDRVFKHSEFDVDASLDYPDLIDSFLTQKRIRDSKALVGATVHHHFHRLVHLYPDAKFIYLLRDGRDVAYSAIGMGWAGNAYCGADIWIEAEARWREMRTKLEPGRYVEARFEELVSDPTTTLSWVCAFLGVEFSPQMLTYPEHSSYRAPDAKLRSQWVARMGSRSLGLVEGRIGEDLERRGYQRVSRAMQEISSLHDAWLRLHSRLACLKYRVDRYGLALTTEEFLARRLGWHRWRRSAQVQLDAIIDQGLR